MLYTLLAVFSAVGFALSALCHLLSWFQLEPPGGEAAFVLHVGIFVVWIPLVFLANRTMPRPGRGNCDHLLQQLPTWARRCVSGLFAYALVNFVVFLALTSRYARNEVPAWLVLRGFSGHWMMFYSMALAGFIGLRRFKRS